MVDLCVCVRASGGSTLNRRGGHAGDNWQPLIWACKDGNLTVAEQLLDNGHDINKTEPLTDKGSSAYAPLHWAATKGHKQVSSTRVSTCVGADGLVGGRVVYFYVHLRLHIFSETLTTHSPPRPNCHGCRYS